MIQNLPVSDVKKYNYRVLQKKMSRCNNSQIIKTDWSANIVNVSRMLHDYWKIKHNLHITDWLIFMKDRLVIPSSMRSEILKCIHKGYMGLKSVT